MHLNNNGFSTLIEPLHELESLRNLSICNNNLNEIPRGLLRLGNLEKLELDGNPLKNNDIFNLSIEEIIEYIKKREKHRMKEEEGNLQEIDGGFLLDMR
jgi:Leucine-rich repeat (LRR) protein